MSKGRLSPSALILDMANNQRWSRVNGALDRSARPRDEDTLRFLSPEEKECLQFFEETIGSLENSLEEDELRTGLKSPASGGLLASQMDGRPGTPDLYTVHPLTARRLSAKDQDIIDLVRPDPDMMLAKFKPTSPDFQMMAIDPESHFEIKPRHDPLDHYETEGHAYQPAGSVPTPVLIAKKIAENQAVGAPNNTSALFQRQRSQEGGERSPDATKQGPPTLAKPTRYPANISRILSHKELQNQPPVPNVNLQDRRALMLSNRPGAPQALSRDDSKPNLVHKLRNAPARSLSFKDPTPEKTRMEALSKLGLARDRDMSGGPPVHDTVDSVAQSPSPSPQSAVTSSLESRLRLTETTGTRAPESKVPPASPQSVLSVVKTEGGLSLEPHRKAPVSPPQSDIISPELNSFGGKSIVVAPGRPKKEPGGASSEAKALPSAQANLSEFNNYGGKSKVLNPATARSDLPDILSSHIDVNAKLPVKVQPLPAELNSYGGKSRTFNPSVGIQRRADGQTGASKGPAPTPAPRTPHVAASADARRRAAAPMFRPQGITVQFSGRGTTEESRKQALKKLGLLKESG
ncbi:specifically androgen-regulated gene protein [Syngnathus typhle]|uniref:specifically androgen-regulated gene protein n=1 Tax=Syngnathus typhle TaxID=161592 RepID=UPI002A6A63EF|nr:specifically androgen-regulated gene protein [Syngnathus typhle]XP_061125365.1 specifically androgen-regulated gene protein [Syngnathus typhle]XP_061125366.1 specifically androgen-regulated gene protein [Syngnathus typhle]